MSVENSCAECGAPLRANLPEGLCSRCALSGALELSGDPGQVCRGISPHRRAFGDYELLEVIARGGMGIVYKARQISLDRIVAVKLLLLGNYASEEFIHRFRIEASAAASLQHPNIVAIHEVGVHQDQHYFAMDYVDGPNLSKLIGNQPLSARKAAGYLKTVAEAIHFAHTRRILHRDLKSSNVLIDSNDQPRVTDFGLAKNLANDSDLTVTGQVLGSPNFMPPEQASGQRDQMGPASDVYSLGAILYHALTGRPAFVSGTISDTLQQLLNTEPVAPRLLVRGIPVDLETICLKCLEKEPGERFPTALQLAEELGRFLRGEPIQSRPVSALEKVWRWCRRKPAIASLGVATILLLLAVAIGSPIAALRIDHALRLAEQNLYAADMNLAFKALEGNYRGEVLRRLERHRPQKKQDYDLRGWEWGYLWSESKSDELFSLPGSSQDIQCLTFSATGDSLAIADAQGRISIWDLAMRQRVAQCDSPICPCLMTFSKDGRHLVSANFMNGLWVWDWVPPNLMSRGPPLIAKGVVSGIDLRDGILTAVDRDRQRLRRWDVANQRELPGFSIQGESEWAVFSPDGRFVATSSSNVVMIWNQQTKAPPILLLGSGNKMYPLAFSPDSQLIVASGNHGDCDVWETKTFRQIVSYPAHLNAVEKGKFSPDGSLFVTASYDHTAKVWNTSDWLKPVAEWSKPLVLRGHLEEVFDAAFSPDGTSIATASADGTVKLWSAYSKPRGENFKRLPNGVRFWSLSPDGRGLFLFFTDQTFSVWNLETGEEFPRQALPFDKLTVAALFADGRQVALGDGRGAVHVLDLGTMKAVPMQTSLSNTVIKLSCSADGSTLVAQCKHDEIKAWQLPAGRELASFSAENNHMFERLPLSPDGRWLVTAPSDGSTVFWELPSLSKRVLNSSAGQVVTGVAFFRDGKVATSSVDKTAQIWDLSTRLSLLKMHSDQTGLLSVALSPDETRLAAGDHLGRVKKVKVWELATGQEVAVLSGHTEQIDAVAFWPDGNTIVSISRDRVHMWRGVSIEKIEAATEAK